MDTQPSSEDNLPQSLYWKNNAQKEFIILLDKNCSNPMVFEYGYNNDKGMEPTQIVFDNLPKALHWTNNAKKQFTILLDKTFSEPFVLDNECNVADDNDNDNSNNNDNDNDNNNNNGNDNDIDMELRPITHYIDNTDGSDTQEIESDDNNPLADPFFTDYDTTQIITDPSWIISHDYTRESDDEEDMIFTFSDFI